jgi:hypothetical protein
MESSDQGYVCRTELPSQLKAKRLGKGGSSAIAALLLIRLFTGWSGLVGPAGLLALTLFAGMLVAPSVIAAVTGRKWEITLLWKAQTFAFGVAALGLVPAVFAPASLYADAVASVLMVLMTLATFTEFCLGRVAYVVLVRAGLPG